MKKRKNTERLEFKLIDRDGKETCVSQDIYLDATLEHYLVAFRQFLVASSFSPDTASSVYSLNEDEKWQLGLEDAPLWISDNGEW